MENSLTQTVFTPSHTQTLAAHTRLFIGPMSKNVVDVIIGFCEQQKVNIGFIPSRRQVEYDGGYVYGWTTESFAEYVVSKTNRCLLERDHGGPGQGCVDNPDDGKQSYKHDVKHMNIIHIDPWKQYQNFEHAIQATIDGLEFCYAQNAKMCFEIGTEEAIRPISNKELDTMMSMLQKSLQPELFERIIFVVIQSGTALCNSENTGTYSAEKLTEAIAIVKSYGKLSKEHNGDWMNSEDMLSRYSLGLDAINIAPEFGSIESEVLLNLMKKHGRTDLIDSFYQLCLKSGKWKKWVSSGFDPENNRDKLITICGHYVFNTHQFHVIKSDLMYKMRDDDVNKIINTKIEQRLKELINCSST